MPWPTTSRHERGYGTSWDKQRLRILKRDCSICQPCLRKGRVHVGTEVDHIIPKSQGGSDDDDNLQCIAHECHIAKTLVDEGKKLRERQAFGVDGLPINGW